MLQFSVNLPKNMKTSHHSSSRRRTKWNPWNPQNRRLINAAYRVWELKQRNKAK